MVTSGMDATLVLDVGKTLTKLTVFDTAGQPLATARHRNAAPGHVLDTESISAWLPDAMAMMVAGRRLRTIVPIAHGAGMAVLDGRRLWQPIMDYEHQGCRIASDAYEGERDPVAISGSPSLPAGLNLGRQLHWLEAAHGPLPTTATLLPLAQYWGWWLTGEMAGEISSLGCHSDLWSVAGRCASPLAQRRGWAARLAPLRRADAVLGRLRPDLATRLNAADVSVLVGAHDSTAALLAARSVAPPGAAVLSTGTWFVAMAPAGAAPGAHVSIDVEGQPVPSARWMGGRFLEESGDKPAACRQAAIMAARLLARLGHAGPLLVEGRFATDALFLSLLATLHPGPVHALPATLDAAFGALLLAHPELSAPPLPAAVLPLAGPNAAVLHADAAAMADLP